MSLSESAPLPVHVRRPAWQGRLARGLRALLYAVLGLWALMLLAWLTLHWGILPRIGEWRPQIERQASQALGAPVHIGAIQVTSNGWVPVVELLDVRLSDPRGRPALRLPRVVAALSPSSLPALELRLAQLHLDSPELVVRRDPDGHWHVAGLDVEAGAAMEGSDAADWLFEQQEIVIEHGRVLWLDETRPGTAPLPLEQVRAVLRNGLRSHEWRIDATPPAAWGDRFSLRGRLRQPLLARAGDWRRWSGQAYAEWPRVDSAALLAGLRLPLRAEGGEGAVRAWLSLKDGQWQQATADLALGSVALRLGEDLQPLAFNRLGARLLAEHRPDGMRLAVEGLQFDTPEGQRWPSSRLELNWQQAGDPLASGRWPSAADVGGGEISADRLDLGLLAALAERLPLPGAWRRQLDELAPQGQVLDLQARWRGSPEQPAHYRVKARLEGLAIAALPSTEAGGVGRPGWKGAQLTLDADETGGQAQLAMREGALLLPGVFADPVLPLNQFSTRLVWSVRPVRGGGAPPQIELRLLDGRFANADAHGDLQLRWQTGPGPGERLGKDQRFPGRLELSGQLQQARAAAVARYLPLGVAAPARQYVEAAVREGNVPRASFRVQGDLWDFPFAQGHEGEFHVSAQVENGVLDYVPAALTGGTEGWPAFTKVSGELVFDRGSMAIRNARARLWGVELQNVNGRVDDLIEHPVLRIEGAGRGPLTDALRFVAASPVAGWTRHALGEASGSGAADLKLALQIPLDDASRTSVKGSVTLAGNELRLRPDVPLLSQARARIDFSETGFAIVGGQARALGGDTLIEGGLSADGQVRVKVQGQATAEGLRQASELGAIARLGAAASGSTGYQLQLGFSRGRTELALTSPLTGLSIDLPPPLRKAAAEAWPLKVQNTLGPEGGALASRDTLRVDLGSALHAEYLREYAADGPRVLRGAVGLGDAAPALPASGVLAVLRLGRVDADDWLAAARGHGLDNGGHGDAGFLPTELLVSAQSLNLARLPLTQLSATLSQRPGEAGTWRAQWRADQAAGQLEWRPGASAQQPGQLQARLSRLAIPAEAGTAPAAAPTTAASARPSGPLPALDIAIAELDWKGKHLGRLELETAGAAAGAREWRIQRLLLQRPDARLQASGAWSALPAPRTALDVKLQLIDSGSLLEQWGMGRVLKGGKGEVSGRIGWPGGPFDPPGGAFSGELHLAVGEGQILKVEPGAGRLLGILSLQSLPRRLTLDFRDVFQEGFSFDDIQGDIGLADGVARTSNLRLRGVQAAVIVEGSADMKRETQDLHMLVVPEINAGTASLAYAAINPVIGLGTFLAQYLLRQPLQQAGTREFRVRGSWDQPLVEPIERQAAEGGRAASAAASGAASGVASSR